MNDTYRLSGVMESAGCRLVRLSGEMSADRMYGREPNRILLKWVRDDVMRVLAALDEYERQSGRNVVELPAQAVSAGV